MEEITVYSDGWTLGKIVNKMGHWTFIPYDPYNETFEFTEKELRAIINTIDLSKDRVNYNKGKLHETPKLKG